MGPADFSTLGPWGWLADMQDWTQISSWNVCLVSKNKEISLNRPSQVYMLFYWQGRCANQNTLDILLPDFSYYSLNQLVTFLYTGEVEITGDMVQDLITLGNFLQLSSIEERCEQFIIDNLEVFNI